MPDYDYIPLGPVPSDENCAQVGSEDYPSRSKFECHAYKELVLRHFPGCEEHVSVIVKSQSHDFGTYREVMVKYNTESKEASDFALKIDNEVPKNWDNEALEFLKLHGIEVPL